jgi:hypothetical protein
MQMVNWIQESRGVLQKRQDIVSKKGDIEVVGEGESIKGVGQKTLEKAIAQQDEHEEILNDVEQYEEREEGVAMNVKCIEPLDSLLRCVAARVFDKKVVIGQVPAKRSGQHANECKINDHSIQNPLQKPSHAVMKCNGISQGRDGHEGDHNRNERWVCT